MKTIQETLRLFNAVQVRNKAQTRKFDSMVLHRTLQHGFVLDPNIPTNVDTLTAIESIVGLSGKKMNASFHKSWSTVRDTPYEVLVMQQLLHYITTYCFGWNDDRVYVPEEYVSTEDFSIEGLELVYVRALTAKEILAEIIKLDASGIALSEQTLSDIMTIVKANNYDSSFVGNIRNRELRTLLRGFYGLVPEEPVEWLRYVIAELTGESLLIKNSALIKKIKAANGRDLDKFLVSAPKNLSSIFLRYKPLFLAMRSISNNKTFFNQLRREAVFTHKPVGEPYLATVTSQLNNGTLNFVELRRELNRASVWAKIRLAYALNTRLNGETDAVVYRVRNGRGWATDRNVSLTRGSNAVLYAVVASIAQGMNVMGKTFVIPENVKYALPSSEKNFVGNFPQGTCVSVSDDMVAGVYWEDTEAGRTDLDLSLIGKNAKIGWDGVYRNQHILFSGDMTSARDGAAELFHVARGNKGTYLLCLNYYNYNQNFPVDARIFVGSDPNGGKTRGRMIDQKNVYAMANVTMEERDGIFGLIEDEKFYFVNLKVGRSAITGRPSEHLTKTLDFYLDSFRTAIDLRDVLSIGGANVVTEKPLEGDYIDLLTLDKTTIINLFG